MRTIVEAALASDRRWARYAFLTCDGAGNQPPAVGIALAPIDRGMK
ncbi:hypothetical protein ACTMU2_11610 [Cupriavidus basilensis]